MIKEASAKEALFCEYYNILHSAREAAARAGYSFPEKTGMRLLKKASVKARLSELGIGEAGPADGLRRIAFGSITDAVRLCLGQAPTEDELEQLDLFMVSEIKVPRGGGLEVKFYDRLKALDMLSSLCSDGAGGAEPFFKALRDGALQLSSEAVDEDGI